MTAKEYLKQIQNIHIRIENKRERLEKIKTILTSPTVGELKQDKVMTSIRLDKQEQMMVEQADLEEELQRLMYEEAELIIKIGKQIDGMENSTYSRILHLRYEEHLNLYDITEKLGYSYIYVREMHGRALQKFADEYLRK